MSSSNAEWLVIDAGVGYALSVMSVQQPMTASIWRWRGGWTAGCGQQIAVSPMLWLNPGFVT